MKMWIIEPRDPLIVRDGRPFGPDPGARAASLPFPFPSTITGGIRHKAGMTANGSFNCDLIDDVRRITVRGPLLVGLDKHGAITQWFAPAPADALALDVAQATPEQDDQPHELQILPLMPLALADDADATDTPDRLAPVGLTRRHPQKVSGSAPAFWTWEAFVAWLKQPLSQVVAPDALGLARLAADTRMHVKVAAASQTAEEGMLFQTSGLIFTQSPVSKEHAAKHGIDRWPRLALAAMAGGDYPHFQGGLAPLGGERRLMRWTRTNDTLPACPPEIRAAIVAHKACRLILLTPALFSAGYRPPLTWERQGVTVELKAAAVPRAQVVSGWDLQTNMPKPSRRLALAGCVYYLTLAGTDAAVGAWVDTHWMAAISDDPQDERDGFGLAALGLWDGQFAKMEVE